MAVRGLLMVVFHGENPPVQPEPRRTMQGIRALMSTLDDPTTPDDALRAIALSADARELGLIVEHPNTGDVLVNEITLRHVGSADILLRALRNRSISDSLFEEIAASVCQKFHGVVAELCEHDSDRGGFTARHVVPQGGGFRDGGTPRFTGPDASLI